MSILIDSTDELLTVLKKLKIQVASVDELRQLLADINANYNPEAARQKTGKLIALSVPGYMAGAAAFVSFFLAGSATTAVTVGGLALIWGATAVVSTAAVVAGALLTGGRRRGQPLADAPPQRRNPLGEELVTGIRKELP